MDRLGWPGVFWFRQPVLLLALLLTLLVRLRARSDGFPHSGEEILLLLQQL
jgi:hypothetical protein